MSWNRRIIAPLLMVVLVAVLVSELGAMAYDRRSTYEFLNPVQDILFHIKRDYVETLDDEAWDELQSGMIRGMLETLDDPYTVYVPAKELADFNKDMRGFYVGIGAHVRMKSEEGQEQRWLTIVTPMLGSPALEAGVRAGDQVREIDGQSTKDEPIDESIGRLMGKPNTNVIVTVHHEGDPEDIAEEITVTRRPISVSTIEGVHRDGLHWNYFLDQENKIGYVRINQFTSHTVEDLTNTLLGLVNDGMESFILDLRFNPGGLLTAAIGVSDLFIEDGAIVSVKGRDTKQETAYAEKPGTLPHFPMVVMVNAHSASASEIVSGALQDHNRAIVVGTRSFGKGLVQDVKGLRSGAGQLKITSAHYLLPSGRSLHRSKGTTVWGVDPDPGFYISVTNKEMGDIRQTQSEMNIIREGNGDGEWNNDEWVRERLNDKQLDAAWDAVNIRMAEGDWRGTSEEDGPNEAVYAQLKTEEEYREALLDQLEQVGERIALLESNQPEEIERLKNLDLIPNEGALADGTIEIKDHDGKTIGIFSFESGAKIEEAMLRADVKPIDVEVDISNVNKENDQ